MAFRKAHVAIGEDADELLRSARNHRKTADAALALDLDDLGDRLIGMDGDRIDHHAALELLDHAHLLGLGGGVEIAVHDAQPPGLRHGDGQPRLCDGVHRGGDQGNVELNRARQPGAGVGLGGQHLGRARLEQHVVKGQRIADFHGRLVESRARFGKATALARPLPPRGGRGLG